MTRTQFAHVAALLAALGIAPLPARAIIIGNCTAGASAVVFGTYDPTAATALTSTGTVTVDCSTAVIVVSSTVTISLSAGASGSFAARHLMSGASVLSYNLYQDAADTQIWGDGTGGSTQFSGTVTVTRPTLTATVYGGIPALQDVAPGAYLDTITVTVNY